MTLSERTTRAVQSIREKPGTIYLHHGDPAIHEGLQKLATTKGYRIEQFRLPDPEADQQATLDPGCLTTDCDQIEQGGLNDLLALSQVGRAACPLICLYRSASTEDAKRAIRSGALADKATSLL